MTTASKQTDEQFDRGALAALYEETFKNFEEGTIIEGRIVAVGKDKVVVDIGYKSEGMIPADQFSTEELQTEIRRPHPSLYRRSRGCGRQPRSVKRKSGQDEGVGGAGNIPQR